MSIEAFKKANRIESLSIMSLTHKTQVTIVGGGFIGLTAAFELVKKGISVTLLEAEAEIGGLAAAFNVGAEKLDRFYHHWFTNDIEVMQLIDELGLNDRVEINPTNTGVYYANNFFKLSTPWDLMNFSPLAFTDRIRLGLLTLHARRVKDWMALDAKTAHEWLREHGGENVYRVVWQPLIKSKFGPYAERISAVWFWNRLKLRSGSRGKYGEERLAYFKGGFVGLADALAQRIRNMGGRIETSAPVSKVAPVDGGWQILTPNGVVTSDRVIATAALPLIADMVRGWAAPDYVKSLERIQYIGNVCLVLELDRPIYRKCFRKWSATGSNATTYGAPAGHSRLWRNITAASSLRKTARKTVFIFAQWLRDIPKAAEPIMPSATVETRPIA